MAVSKILDKIGGIVGLNDPESENVHLTPDRISVGGSNAFTTVDQQSITTGVFGQVKEEQLRSAVDIPGSKETQGEKFYLIKMDHWNHERAYLDQVTSCNVVSELKSNYHAVFGLTQFHKYGRFGLEVIVQINPTPFQQGGLICAMIPGYGVYSSLAGYKMYPHGILNANQNNMCRIKVPFVYTRGMYDFHSPLYEPWFLDIRVLAPLELGADTSTDVGVAILARFTDLELHGLTPLSQMMRAEFRISSTNELVNMANQQGSAARITLALDEESALSDTSVGGGMKLTNFRTYTETPGIMTHFAFPSGTVAGTRILTFPVNPYYYTTHQKSLGNHHPTPLASIASMYQYWRGDMVYHFQVFPSKFHSGRLLIVFIPGNEKTEVNSIPMLKATNGYCATMDINGSASTLVFRVPWVCDNPYRVNTYASPEDPAANSGVFSSIGKISVYVYTHLTGSPSIANHVWVSVWVSATNLELMCPIYHSQGAEDVHGEAYTMAGEIEPTKEGDAEGFGTTGEVCPIKLGPGLKQVGAVDTPPTGAVTCIEDPALALKKPETFPELHPGSTRHSADHMDMYKFMGRAHFYSRFVFNNNEKVYTIPFQLNVRGTNFATSFPSTLRWFWSLFHLYRGPLDVTIVIDGASDVDGMMWFSPRGASTGRWWSEVDSNHTMGYKAALGLVRFNTKRTGNIQVRLPWYNDCPAITAHTAGQIDCDFGSISLQISNYTKADEYISFAVYLSVTEESEFLFPRAPLFANRIRDADLKTYDDDLEVATVLDEESTRFNEYREEQGDTKYYKDVRMEVGKWRLEYAKDELRRSKEELAKAKLNKKTKWFSKSAEKLSTDLVSMSNILEEGVLVRRVDGNFVLRGFYYCGEVYYADCEPRAARHLPSFRYGCFKCVKDDGSWISSHKKLDLKLCQAWANSMYGDEWFNFKGYFDGNYPTLSEGMRERLAALSESELTLLLDNLRPIKTSMVDTLFGDSVITTEIRSDMSKVAEECTSLIESVRKGAREFSRQWTKRKSGLICRLIMNLVKVGTSMYVCQHFNWAKEAVLPCIANLVIDVALVGCDLKLSLQELVSSTLSEFDNDLKTQSLNWMRDVVAGITIFRAAKDAFLWLVNKIKDWYANHNGETKKILDALQENEAQIEKLMADSDSYVLKQFKDNDKDRAHAEGCDLLYKLRTLQLLVTKDKELLKFSGLLRDSSQKVVAKVKALGHISETVISRPEPTVVYLWGKRGGGKSLLSMCLATKICKALGVDPVKNIYTKPVGSDYWDGYENQLVCVIDDIGQRSDDSDWADFCQLVSGCPMRLNMAALEEKGKHFTSPYIICTSNLPEPMPKTVYSLDAIRRRLHLKLQVVPGEKYRKKGEMKEILDVAKARAENAMAEMDCLQITNDGVLMTVPEIVDFCLSSASVRSSNMKEFIDLWSQSEDSMLGEALEKILGSEPKLQCKRGLLDWIKDHHVMIVTGVLGMLAFAGAMFGTYRAVQYFRDKQRPESEGAYSGMPKPNNIVKLHLQEAQTMSVLEISNMIRKNLVRFGVGDSDEDVKWMLNGLGLRDDWLLVPSHAYKFDKHHHAYFFLEKGGTFYCTLREKVEIVTLDTGFQDVVLMRFPGIQPFKNIVSHFVKRDDLDKCDGKLATLCTINGGIFQMISEGIVRKEDAVDYKHKVETGGEEILLRVPCVWRGHGDCLPGSCGGALVSSNNKLQNPIIGIHVAGGPSGLISKCVWREMFDVIDVRQNLPKSQRIVKCEFSSQRLHSGAKTRFKRSPIGRIVEKRREITYPAVMPYANSEIDAIQVMLSKYDQPMVQEPDGYHYAKLHVIGKLAPLITDHGHLSIKEAIEGIDGLDAIDMNTSPGIPYVFHGLTKKDLIFKDEKGAYDFHPMLMSNYMMVEYAAEHGLELDIVFATCAKDELRPKAKVETSNTRAIECSPLHFTLYVRRVWGEVIAQLQSHPGWHSGIAVGMDPDRDWDPMMRAALRFADDMIDLDFKAFDASLSDFMVLSACDVLSRLSQIPHTVGDSISCAIAYSQHQMGDMRFLVEGCMPSGTPCTSLLNSIANQINVYFVLAQCFNCSFSGVDAHFKFLCYGDDIVLLISRNLECDRQELCRKLVAGLEKLGMKATSSDKGPVKVRPVMDLEFLKRKVAYWAGRFYPSMSDRTVWSMLAWIRTTAEFEVNLDTACWFVALRGPEKYKEFIQELKEILKIERVEYKCKSFDHWLARISSLDHSRNFDEHIVNLIDVFISCDE